jgi:hypothetical protein
VWTILKLFLILSWRKYLRFETMALFLRDCSWHAYTYKKGGDSFLVTSRGMRFSYRDSSQEEGTVSSAPPILGSSYCRLSPWLFILGMSSSSRLPEDAHSGLDKPT